ncbi:MAG TPA: phenylalanine 4-monooxygenase [Solimonas sp.]
MYGAQSESELRGDYRRAAIDFTVDQAEHVYATADHALWRRLYARQSDLVGTHACREFREALAAMRCADAVPQLARINPALQVASGWALVAVPGFIPDAAFFAHLAARRFPVTVWLRKPEEFDYLVEPDLFHDFFGHVPMLFHRRFADYMQRFGELGLQAIAQDALPLVARLYWYTVEFGLIDGDEGLRCYGAGILSSGGETRYALESPQPQRLRYVRDRVMRTRYRIDAYQKTYFVLRTLDELLESVADDLRPALARLRALPEFSDDVCAADDVALPQPHTRNAA